MASNKKKSLGSCIDEMLKALQDVDDASRVIAMRAVCEHLNISIGIPKSLTEQGPLRDRLSVSSDTLTIRPQEERVLDIRTLKEQKKPRSAMEMVCVVAYYLENHAPDEEKKTEITAKDITKYFKQAGFSLPKVRTQLLIDTKVAGYMDSKKRGRYKLSPVGYNLVAYVLPREKEKR